MKRKILAILLAISYGLGALDYSLVYMCICQGFMSTTLVDSFIYSGAGAVTANTDTVRISGDYFAGGDDTIYHTEWYSKSYDIPTYAGECITLTFHTGDVGDSAYDTAGILDDIKIFVEK